MNVREAYKEEVGYGQGCSCIPLEHLIGFFSIMNIFFDHEREIYELRVLQKELNNHIERINKSSYDFNKKQEYIDNYKRNYDKKARLYLKDIRKARRRKLGIKLSLRTEEQAKELLEKAKLENVFPKKVQKQIKRLEGNWVNFTHCLRDKKIPPTSNKVEQYYAISLNWIEKNRSAEIVIVFVIFISITAVLFIYLNPQEIIKQASDTYDAATRAQREGDWARYGEEIKKLGEILGELQQ